MKPTECSADTEKMFFSKNCEGTIPSNPKFQGFLGIIFKYIQKNILILASGLLPSF